MRFAWDPVKAWSNLRKHGVSFAAAARGLSDPDRFEEIDDRFDDGEERFTVLCRYGTIIAPCCCG